MIPPPAPYARGGYIRIDVECVQRIFPLLTLRELRVYCAVVALVDNRDVSITSMQIATLAQINDSHTRRALQVLERCHLIRSGAEPRNRARKLELLTDYPRAATALATRPRRGTPKHCKRPAPIDPGRAQPVGPGRAQPVGPGRAQPVGPGRAQPKPPLLLRPDQQPDRLASLAPAPALTGARARAGEPGAPQGGDGPRAWLAGEPLAGTWACPELGEGPELAAVVAVAAKAFGRRSSRKTLELVMRIAPLAQSRAEIEAYLRFASTVQLVGEVHDRLAVVCTADAFESWATRRREAVATRLDAMRPEAPRPPVRRAASVPKEVTEALAPFTTPKSPGVRAPSRPDREGGATTPPAGDPPPVKADSDVQESRHA